MSPRAARLVVVPVEAPLPANDWRPARLQALIDYDVLADEWDEKRLLLTPRPGGPLTRVPPCSVPLCPNVRHGASPLCNSHLRQFSRSGSDDLGRWLASDEPRLLRRHWCSDATCVVSDGTGQHCPRPAVGARGLCHAHEALWADQRAGICFEEFLTRATPMADFGACAAASCYLGAAYKHSRLCPLHYTVWAQEGRPDGRAFDTWAARVRQPANALVLSLRGLPELVRLELLYAISLRVKEQIRTAPWNMRTYVDQIRAAGVSSITEFDPAAFDADGDRDYGRFARFALDRVRLAYGDPETERDKDTWDLRLFGRSGQLDFSSIRQDWLREATKAWAGIALVRIRSKSEVQHRVQAVGVLSRVLASGPGGGNDPATLGRRDVERFLLRIRSVPSTQTGQPYSPRRAAGIVEDCSFILREVREMGLVPSLAPTFALRRGDGGRRVVEQEPGRALPVHVVAQLDAQLGLLHAVPGSLGGPAHRSLGVLGERAGEMAVLTYQLLKGTGRRVGEIASLHLECLDVDEHAKAVLVYDNHKAGRMARRLPIADSKLVEDIRSQQAWVAQRFPDTERRQLWLLPRANKNADGTTHLSGHQILMWMRAWVRDIPTIDAGLLDKSGEPVPFNRRAIHPHAWRHTYAQTLADQGVPPPVLRDLMDHRSLSTTLSYYSIGEAKKREAMELLARHTIDNSGTTRPLEGKHSRAAELREQLSWVAVPMGKCAEPTNVRAGGGACPIRYQCAGCPHFESDPSFLPELRVYADDLRTEREAMLASGAADWALDGVTRQLEVIVGHIHQHEEMLQHLSVEQRAQIEEASITVRKARQSVPVAIGRRRELDGHD